MRWNPPTRLAATLLLLGSSTALAAGSSEPGHQTATFSMYCYWTGEATLGRVDGVVASRIGHWQGNEIVQVDYDPERTGPREMIEALKSQRSFYALVLDGESSVPAGIGSQEVARKRGEPRFIEPKHTLRTRHPELVELDLTERQAIALNSWSFFGGRMPEVLTEEQRRRLSSR